jgi:hypothetical protein
MRLSIKPVALKGKFQVTGFYGVKAAIACSAEPEPGSVPECCKSVTFSGCSMTICETDTAPETP